MINTTFQKKDNIIQKYSFCISKEQIKNFARSAETYQRFSQLNTNLTLNSRKKNKSTLKHAIYLNNSDQILIEIECEKEKNNGNTNTEWYVVTNLSYNYGIEQFSDDYSDEAYPNVDNAQIFVKKLTKHKLEWFIFTDSMLNNSWKDNFFTRITHTFSDMKNIFRNNTIKGLTRKELLKQ